MKTASKISEHKKEDALLEPYLRGNHNIPIGNIKDKKLKGNLRKTEAKFKNAAVKAVQSELLLTEDKGFLEVDNMEKTFKFSQKILKEHVDMNTKNKMFELKLDEFGPYKIDYTKNGRNLLIGGKKGHVATFDWKSGKLGCELHLRESVKDVKWLHNETMFAVAQKKYTYIYDNTGMEIHCLRDHIEVNSLDYLNYHFLLVSVGNAGYLKYRDTSTGKIVAEMRTGLGRCDTMTQNNYNAIMHLGHNNGTVTLWSPNVTTPLVKMFTHRGPVNSIAIDRGGNYMATSGLDGHLKIWDIRTYKPLHDYYTPTPASSVCISDTGLLAVGFGPNINVWKDALKTKATSPYMTHLQPSCFVEDMQFCPFEDILGFGHSNGIRSLVIPGSGEANFDSMEANPYQTKKQRQESEVHNLMDKIQPEMISINPDFIGNLDRAPTEVKAEERVLEWEANNPTEKFVPKRKQRGKSSAQRKYNKKQSNVIDSNKLDLLKKIKAEKAKNALAARIRSGGGVIEERWDPFNRFKVNLEKSDS